MSKRILVAEDSSVIQSIAKKVFEFQGYEVDFAKTGKEVLIKLVDNVYDVILMDIMMPPGMDGLECTRMIRTLPDPRRSNIPIIAVTGNSRNFSREEYQALGINELVQKPIDFDRLVQIVKNLSKEHANA